MIEVKRGEFAFIKVKTVPVPTYPIRSMVDIGTWYLPYG
jgi:hypothetical protein